MSPLSFNPTTTRRQLLNTLDTLLRILEVTEGIMETMTTEKEYITKQVTQLNELLYGDMMAESDINEEDTEEED